MMKTITKVSLVGAGPGDPGLLTLKALDRIQRADVIVYDTLANPQHLQHAKPSAKKLCVGQGFRHRKISQKKINQLIVSQAKKGLRVVRLKGGDPCLFGRGGEEALFLVSKGVPFEFIPGVTSGTAAAAYAGVPLTHRDHNAAVTFVTGHRADDSGLDSIDWKKIADLHGTIVVYMGFYNLGRIAQKLIQAGLPSNTSILVVEWGTLGRQQSVVGTLQNIEKMVRSKKLGPPCLLVIGDVVKLRKKLSWFETLPLYKKKIVVTRPGGSANRLSSELRELGADVYEFPVISIVPPKSWRKVDLAIRKLASFDWVIFTSASGVKMFLGRLFSLSRMDARAFGCARIAAIGPETARCLEDFGLKADRLPKKFETNSLAQAFTAKDRGRSALLVRTGLADKKLDRAMKKIFGTVHRVDAYRTVSPKNIPKDTLSMILGGQIDLVTFTSASTVNFFVKKIGLKRMHKLGQKVQWASIGPATSAALRQCGLKPRYEANVHTFHGLVEAITNQ